jgi:hypothetical protein
LSDRETYRRLLGDERMDALEREAMRWQEEERLILKDEGELETEIAALRDEVGEPLESVDRAAAYETRRLQRDAAVAERRVEEGLNGLMALGISPSYEPTTDGAPLGAVERADEMLGELSDRRIFSVDRPSRVVLPAMSRRDHERAERLGQVLVVDRDRLHKLRTRERQLWDDGTHLDRWAGGLPETLPRLWAREDELASRVREVDRASEREGVAGLQPIAARDERDELARDAEQAGGLSADEERALGHLRGRTRQGSFAAQPYDWDRARWDAALEGLRGRGYGINHGTVHIADDPGVTDGWTLAAEEPIGAARPELAAEAGGAPNAAERRDRARRADRPPTERGVRPPAREHASEAATDGPALGF